MTKQLIRKLFFEMTRPLLKQYGFISKNKTISDWSGYEKYDDNILCWFFLSLDSELHCAIIWPRIRYDIVESIVCKIRSIDSSAGATIDIQSRQIMKEYTQNQKLIKNEQDVIELSENFKRYFVELYLPAFEKYSKPEKVLQLWDSLDTVEKKNSYFPSPDRYIKILIFSKMCNEPQFEDRCRESISRYETILNSEETQNNEMLKTGYTEDLENCKKVIEYLRVNEV